MAEATQLMLSHKELVGLILKKEGINTGIWTIAVEFILGVGVAAPPNQDGMPTAMSSVSRIGIQQAPELTSTTFDAAELNPVEEKPEKKRSPQKKIDTK